MIKTLSSFITIKYLSLQRTISPCLRKSNYYQKGLIQGFRLASILLSANKNLMDKQRENNISMGSTSLSNAFLMKPMGVKALFKFYVFPIHACMSCVGVVGI